MKRAILYCCLLSIAAPGCSHSSKRPGKKQKHSTGAIQNKKPGSSFSGTLKIESAAAVFYSPDSLQLARIKSITDPQIFDGIEHENFYLMRNAHNVIRKEYPGLKVIDAKDLRYLLFVHGDNTTDIIDLDEKTDPWGLYIFDTKKSPLLVDMANIDTELGFYFPHRQ